MFYLQALGFEVCWVQLLNLKLSLSKHSRQISSQGCRQQLCLVTLNMLLAFDWDSWINSLCFQLNLIIPSSLTHRIFRFTYRRAAPCPW